VSTTPEMTITRLVPWFGANAANADVPARLLSDCRWVYIPFAGSMTEIPHFPAATQIMVSDKHDELICLATIVADEVENARLAERLAGKLLHPREIEQAKEILERARAGGDSWLWGDGAGGRPTPEECAEAFFVIAWMGRSGVSGTRGELATSLALRYDAGGGDPVKRYRSAVESLEAWHQALRRCSFSRADAFEVLERLRHKDADQAIGIYADPPWPDDGDGYLHRFSDADHRRLVRALESLPHRAVVRYGDHPLIRELYRPEAWTWHEVTGRDQHRQGKAEVFLERRTQGARR
jgi:site-specific DNA-adenine methylase